MVEPSSKHSISPQFAMVFVRNKVVRIVRARAVESDPTHHFSRDRQARDDAVCPVRIAFYFLWQCVDIAEVHRTLNATGWSEDSALVDDQVAGAQLGDVVLSNVITERPKQLGNHHLCPGCHSPVTRGITCEEPD